MMSLFLFIREARGTDVTGVSLDSRDPMRSSTGPSIVPKIAPGKGRIAELLGSFDARQEFLLARIRSIFSPGPPVHTSRVVFRE
jgi:hypothetical protein